MFNNAGQLSAKTKAVGQKDVRAFFAELFHEIPVSEKYVPEKSFRGGNVYIAVFVF